MESSAKAAQNTGSWALSSAPYILIFFFQQACLTVPVLEKSVRMMPGDTPGRVTRSRRNKQRHSVRSVHSLSRPPSACKLQEQQSATLEKKTKKHVQIIQQTTTGVGATWTTSNTAYLSVVPSCSRLVVETNTFQVKHKDSLFTNLIPLIGVNDSPFDRRSTPRRVSSRAYCNHCAPVVVPVTPWRPLREEMLSVAGAGLSECPKRFWNRLKLLRGI